MYSDVEKDQMELRKFSQLKCLTIESIASYVNVVWIVMLNPVGVHRVKDPFNPALHARLLSLNPFGIFLIG